MHSEGVVPTCAADGGTEHGCEVLLPTPVYLATSGEPRCGRQGLIAAITKCAYGPRSKNHTGASLGALLV